MATKASVASKTATSKKDAEEDLATLIYRESQLRLRKARNSCCCKEQGKEATIICFNSTNYNSEKICCCG
jgi:hypothetical protein